MHLAWAWPLDPSPFGSNARPAFPDSASFFRHPHLFQARRRPSPKSTPSTLCPGPWEMQPPSYPKSPDPQALGLPGSPGSPAPGLLCGGRLVWAEAPSVLSLPPLALFCPHFL